MKFKLFLDFLRNIIFTKTKPIMMILPKYQFAPPPPLKKELGLMYSILDNAVKYNNSGDKDISKKILKILSETINEYCDEK